MLFVDSQVRLTKSELNKLRQANARHGFAVNEVHTREELIDAIVHGLPESIQRGLDTFLESTATDASEVSTNAAQK